MSYRRKSKMEFTPRQLKTLDRLAKQHDRELAERFARYVTQAIDDKVNCKLTLVVTGGHLESIVRGQSNVLAAPSRRAK